MALSELQHLPLISYPRLVGTTVPLFGPTVGVARPRPAPAPPVIPPPAPPGMPVGSTAPPDTGLRKTKATDSRRSNSTNGPLKPRSVPNRGSICRRNAAQDPRPKACPSPVDTVSKPSDCYPTAARISPPGTAGYVLVAADDATITPQPTRNVDYLSHDWKEEEIWSSWKYILSERQEDKTGRRLENALWRIWMKAKKKLATVHPERINWWKDCDVTWLYGPLQTGGGGTTGAPSGMDQHRGEPPNSTLTNKKSILKRRSMAQEILGGLRVATVPHIQKKDKGVGRTRFINSRTGRYQVPVCSRQISREDDGVAADIPYSTSEGNGVRFNEEVEQRIIVGIMGDDDDQRDGSA